MSNCLPELSEFITMKSMKLFCQVLHQSQNNNLPTFDLLIWYIFSAEYCLSNLQIVLMGHLLDLQIFGLLNSCSSNMTLGPIWRSTRKLRLTHYVSSCFQLNSKWHNLIFKYTESMSLGVNYSLVSPSQY